MQCVSFLSLICHFFGAPSIFLGQAWADGKGKLATCRHRADSGGETGKNVRRHSLDRLHASMIKQKKKTQAVITILQLASESPICLVSRRSQAVAFLPSLSRVARWSLIVSWEPTQSSHIASHHVASPLNGTMLAPTFTVVAGVIVFCGMVLPGFAMAEGYPIPGRPLDRRLGGHCQLGCV